MNARLGLSGLLLCLSAIAVADSGVPVEAWRALPERSLHGATLPLRINIFTPEAQLQAEDNLTHRALSPVSRALAEEQDDEGELKRRSEKRIEVQYGQDRWQIKLRRRGIVMKMLFD